MKKGLLATLAVLTGLFLLSDSIVWAVDLPMVICKDSIKANDGSFGNIGRVFNRHSDTARWTDYGPCSDGRVNANDVIGLISCDGSIDPGPIFSGIPLATSVGVTKPVLDKVRDCFFADNTPRIINVTLPVVDCNEKDICGAVIAAINVNIVWVSEEGCGTSDVPVEVLKADGLETEWYGGDIVDEAERWQSFVNHFNLEELDGEKPIMVDKKSIYFNIVDVLVPPPIEPLFMIE
jgi:hypothetical protein